MANTSSRRNHSKNWTSSCMPKRQGGMGFKNLVVYNSALLTKTAWQLIHNQESLCAKILLGKYCPNGDILHYSLQPRTSWIWQSIYHGLQQVKRLSIWQVGDGKDINIWRHRWIPGSKGTLLQPNELNLNDCQYVAELIDEDNQSWKVDLLQKLFTQDQVSQILTIPLDMRRKDKLIWPLTSMGKFTTKSAYNSLAITGQTSRTHQQGIMPTLWLKLWKLKIPYKLIHFLWKLLHDILPVRTTILGLRSPQDKVCPMCYQVPETSTHLVMQCSFAHSVWNKCSPHLANNAISFNNIRDWIISWADKTSNVTFQQHDTIHYAAYIMWVIWKHRCEHIFQNKTPNQHHLIKHIRQYCDWQHLKITNNSVLQQRTNTTHHWQPPPEGYFKFNIDASMLPYTKLAGIAILIRDSAGRYVDAMGLLQPARNVKQAEAWGLLHAMQWANQLNHKKVKFETDNLHVVNLLQQNLAPHWQDECIISRCYSLLEKNSDWSCVYVNRVCNAVADKMAKYVRLNNLARVRWSVCPSEFRGTLQADCIHSLS